MEVSLRTRLCDTDFRNSQIYSLYMLGIHTLGDLIKYSEQELLKKNISRKRVHAINRQLGKYGFSLASKEKSAKDHSAFSPKERSLKDAGFSLNLREQLNSLGYYTLGNLANLTYMQLKKEGVKNRHLGFIQRRLREHNLSIRGESRATAFIRKQQPKIQMVAEDLRRLEVAIGTRFNNIDLLRQATTSRSFYNVHKDENGCYESFEILGDAILRFIVVEYLLGKFPKITEHDITEVRNFLVSNEVLARISRSLGIPSYIRLSYAESRKIIENERLKQRIYANVFESIIGAYYIDRGIEAVGIFIINSILPEVDSALIEAFNNPIMVLNDLVQARERKNPEYRCVTNYGDKLYKVEIYVKDGKQVIGVGTGIYKKEAKTRAAKDALANYVNNE